MEYIAACKETDNLFFPAEQNPDPQPVLKDETAATQEKENKNVPAEQQEEEERKRLQVRVYARGTKKLLKTFSRFSVEEVVKVSNVWLYNNGYPQIEQFSGVSMRWDV